LFCSSQATDGRSWQEKGLRSDEGEGSEEKETRVEEEKREKRV
jgi:hypothetical protein